MDSWLMLKLTATARKQIRWTIHTTPTLTIGQLVGRTLARAIRATWVERPAVMVIHPPEMASPLTTRLGERNLQSVSAN